MKSLGTEQPIPNRFQIATRASDEACFFVIALLNFMAMLINVLRCILFNREKDPLIFDNLALKGGVAINLTIFDLPRLSMDIDMGVLKARDLFDMFNLQKFGLFGKEEENLFKKCIMFYCAISSETVPKCFDFNKIDKITTQKIKQIYCRL